MGEGSLSLPAIRAGLLLLLVGATPALATAPAFSFERLTTYEVQGSPGELIVLPARISNSGSAPETFPFAGLASNTSGAWQVYPPPTSRVDAGAQRTVDGFVSLPTIGGVSMVYVRACAQSSPTTCRDVSWRVSTPPVVTLSMQPSYSSLGTVHGSVDVAWLNGEPLRDLAVRITQQTTPVTITSTEEFRTDATGRAGFELASPVSRVPGRHLVFVEVSLPNLPTTTVSGSYTVGAG